MSSWADDYRQYFPVTRNWAYFNHAATAPYSTRTAQALQRYVADFMENGGTNYALSCGGSLNIASGAYMVVYSGPTNGTAQDYGAQVSVAHDLYVDRYAWLYPCAHETDGGTPVFRVRNLTVRRYGGINSNSKGYVSRIMDSA